MDHNMPLSTATSVILVLAAAVGYYFIGWWAVGIVMIIFGALCSYYRRDDLSSLMGSIGIDAIVIGYHYWSWLGVVGAICFCVVLGGFLKGTYRRYKRRR